MRTEIKSRNGDDKGSGGRSEMKQRTNAGNLQWIKEDGGIVFSHRKEVIGYKKRNSTGDTPPLSLPPLPQLQ